MLHLNKELKKIVKKTLQKSLGVWASQSNTFELIKKRANAQVSRPYIF